MLTQRVAELVISEPQALGRYTLVMAGVVKGARQ